MARFDGTVALISGGARGMGASHARGLVAEGAKVVIGDILDEEGEALANELRNSARFIHLDVTRDDDWVAAVELAEQAYGPVDLLVNNAGVVNYGAVGDLSPDEFRRVVDVNLTGTYLGMYYTVPSLRRAGGGVIINVSSTAGLVGYAMIPAYVASKWGIRGLTKTAALDLARDNIRVMSLHPGAIKTAFTVGLSDEATASNPIPRIGEPEEITKLLLFIAADATFCTGSEWVADGGEVLPPVVELFEE